MGAGANIGAGTIICNYDGFDKHETQIGEGAFIGSNTALVAPVTVGAGAYHRRGLGDHPRRAGGRPGAGPRPAGGEARRRPRAARAGCRGEARAKDKERSKV